jgi:pilus assembly protein FimV
MIRRSRWFGILALLLIPVSATPLGLGDITLNSHLNERLDAEIPVSVAGPEELQTLKVTVASRDVFERFGVERLDFMEDLRFTVESRPGGQAIVRVRSAQPVVEPFLTFLIEARSSGGRLLREYTVLLDPPMFLPEPEAVQPAPAPPIQPAPSAGVISRPEAQQARPAPRPDRAVTAAPATTYGPVRRAETLWGIAEQVRPDGSVSMNQVMVSLFLANPDAFDGNINRLRAGARLRVPDFTEMTRLSRGEAAAEVRRQNTEWRAGRVASAGPAAAAQPAPAPAAAPREKADEPSRLELVPPARETEAAPGPGTVGETPAEAEYRAEQEALNDELLAAVQSLRRELEETRQLIGIKDGEIASLQDRLAGLEDQGVPATPPPAEGAAGLAEPDAPAAQPEAAAPQESAAPAPTPAPEPAQPTAQLASEEEGGIFSSLWTWLLIIVVALLGAAVAWKRRQGGETEDYRSWAADEGIEPEPVAAGAGGAGMTGMAAAGTAGSLAEEAPASRLEERIFAEEPEPEPERAIEPATPASEPAAGKAAGESTDDTGEYAYPFEDTIAGATGINLEQSDPLAEADFHMAYGLYDQAAELIQKAIDREPDRTDLRMKLLDILFVWGKQDEFLSEAQNLKGRLGDAESSDWDRVAIMGRQICPDEALFDTGGHEEADTADSDVDFELGEEARTSGQAESIDFDLGATGEMPAIEPEEDETVTGPDATAELEIEDLGLDIDLPEEELPRAPEETGATVAMESVEEPEEETGKTEILEGADTEGPGEEETGLTEVLDRVDEAADDQTAVVRARDLDLVDLDSDSETKEMPALSEAAPSGDDDTAEVEALSEDDLDLDDLTRSFEEDDLDKTAEIPVAGQGPEGESLIEEIFGEEDEGAESAAIGDIPTDAGDLESTRELPQPKPSDVTLSEVGTKLDLARAYLDMGDPDGARSILEEVVEEGDDAQQKEARQLLDGLS